MPSASSPVSRFTVASNMSSARRSIVAAAFLCLQALVWGQAVDPSVSTIDLSVNARVQDSDLPDTSQFPGPSGSWTGQLNMPPASAPSVQTGASRPSQFPSLTGMSSWGGVPFNASNPQTGSTPPQTSSATQDRNALFSASQWTKLTGSRKRTMVLSDLEVEPKKSNATDEFSAERNESADPKAQARMLKRAQQKTARVKIVNPFQNKADATNAGRWRGTVLTASSLEQQRHQEALLLHRGYGANDERRRRRRKSGRGVVRQDNR